jgi:hypothetical protein
MFLMASQWYSLFLEPRTRFWVQSYWFVGEHLHTNGFEHKTLFELDLRVPTTCRSKFVFGEGVITFMSTNHNFKRSLK